MIFNENEDGGIIEEVEYIGKSVDPRKEKVTIKKDKEVEEDYKRFFKEIDSIKEKRRSRG